MSERSHDQFTAEVLPAELEELRRRRAELGIDTSRLNQPGSVDQRLVGLALSGGGIRSATFSLGVVQALADANLLRSVDYLSTVSGGGFIGSCLSSLLNEPSAKPDKGSFPLEQVPGAEEPPALTHLRNSSNYLSPGGLLSRLRLPNLLLRGIVLNFFLFLPFIMAAVFLTEVAYEFGGPYWDLLPRAIPPLLALFLLLAIAFPFVSRALRSWFGWTVRNRYELMLTVPLLLAIIVALMVPVLELVRLAIETNWDDWVAHLIADLQLNPFKSWEIAVPVALISILFLLAGKGSQNVSRLRGQLLLYTIGLVGPAIIFGTYLLLCLWQVDSPFIPVAYGDEEGVPGLTRAAECNGPCLNDPEFANAPARPGLIHGLKDVLIERDVLASEAQVAAAVVCVLDPAAEWRPPLGLGEPVTSPVWRIHFASDATGCDQPGYTVRRFSRTSLKVQGAGLGLFDGLPDYYFFAFFFALLVFNHLFLDVNITSIHGFYRDRLSQAYLIRPGTDGKLEPNDEQPLSELHRDGTSGPYHLINVALNLQASKDPGLRGRNADFFIFSKRFVGGTRTGYSRTEALESYDRHLDLGTAMAISGAAAAPNMGSTTVKPLVFILTLLNIRLGYWLPNPIRVNKGGWLTRLALRGAGPKHVVKEALGRLDLSGSHVNVSDGGHIENLGIYPLLARRCKYIIAVDAEADPTMRFDGLVKLSRYARIDLGIDIDIDLEGLRKDAEGLSKRHWVLGTIHYGEHETGYLIYLKSSVTGNENEYVRAYRAQHPAFPHEPTSDQFFSETQFESYRALGQQIGAEMVIEARKRNELRDLMETANG